MPVLCIQKHTYKHTHTHAVIFVRTFIELMYYPGSPARYPNHPSSPFSTDPILAQL